LTVKSVPPFNLNPRRAVGESNRKRRGTRQKSVPLSRGTSEEREGSCFHEDDGVLLPLDFYAAPEGDVVFDIGGRWFRIGVVPGRTWSNIAIDNDVVVTRHALPGT